MGEDRVKRRADVSVTGCPPVLREWEAQIEALGWRVYRTNSTPETRRATLDAANLGGSRMHVAARYTDAVGSRDGWRGSNRNFYIQLSDGRWFKLKNVSDLLAFAADPRPKTLETMKITRIQEPYVPFVPKGPRCKCQKVKFSRKDAEEVVVKSKVKRVLFGNQRRRETHAYQCPFNKRIWHVSSNEGLSPASTAARSVT